MTRTVAARSRSTEDLNFPRIEVLQLITKAVDTPTTSVMHLGRHLSDRTRTRSNFLCLSTCSFRTKTGSAMISKKNVTYFRQRGLFVGLSSCQSSAHTVEHTSPFRIRSWLPRASGVCRDSRDEKTTLSLSLLT